MESWTGLLSPFDSREEIYVLSKSSNGRGLEREEGGEEAWQTSTSTREKCRNADATRLGRVHTDAAREPAREHGYINRENAPVAKEEFQDLSLSLSLCARFARECVAIMQSGTLARIGQPRI